MFSSFPPLNAESAALALRPNRPQPSNDPRALARAAQGDVFAREVDDALREDEALNALRKWGKPIGAAVVLGLVALGGWLWYDNHQASQLGKQSETMTLALDQVEADKVAAANPMLAGLAKDGTPGYRAAAQLLQAGLTQDAAQKGDRPDAAKLDAAAKGFAAVSADTKAPQAYRDLATIRETALRFDAMPPQQVVDRLKPLAVPGNPWFGSAGELVGLAYLKQGRNDLAGPLFAAMAKDKTVPDSIRRRARQVAGSLGIDAVDDVSAVMAQAQGQ